MTTQGPSGSYGPDDTADLVRSAALSSARLWEEVLERLSRVEQAQAELAQSLSRLQLELPAGPTAAPLAPGAAVPLAPPPGSEVGPAPHFVAPPPPPQGFGAAPPPPPPPPPSGFQAAPADAMTVSGGDVVPPPPPPPPPPGFGSVGAHAPDSANGTVGPTEGLLVDVSPVPDELTTGSAPTSTGPPPPPDDAVFDLPPVTDGVGADVGQPPPPPPPPPPPGFAVASPEPAAIDAAVEPPFIDVPPLPPPGFAADAPPPPPPPPPGFEPEPVAAAVVDDVPAGYSADDLTGLGAVDEPSPSGFAAGLAAAEQALAPPPGPPPSAPPGFSVADVTAGNAVGAPAGAVPPPPPPPGFSPGGAPEPVLDEPAVPGYGSDPFGDLLGDLDSAAASAAPPPAPPGASDAGRPPAPPPGFATGGGSFADLPIVTPELADADAETGGAGGAPRTPVRGREGSTPGPRSEPPITPDFFARAGRRKR